ncbi:L-threonylcarbamoyladenylate synthase [Tessaracoccus antarcticus]|uniref:L-threonylcarbamoyladenylate synthase n=1 Tax=Tessaracoccus antarcticus TaxID=2479848 RepID=UPI0026D0D307
MTNENSAVSSDDVSQGEVSPEVVAAPPAVHDLFVQAEAGIAAAADAVAAGQCIVLPTDTVYGIGADAFSSDAVQKLLDAKHRGRDMPPPVLVAEPSMLRALTSEVPQDAAALAKAFWPGALTLILKAQKTLHLKVGETDGTVAVRVPDHDGARALLRRTGPLAVSSANLSGQDAATTCDEARAALGDSVAVYLDGGTVGGQGASTIVDFSRSDRGRVLRAGALSFEDLVAVATRLEPLPEPATPDSSQLAAPVEPEQLEAPDASQLAAPVEPEQLEAPDTMEAIETPEVSADDDHGEHSDARATE